MSIEGFRVSPGLIDRVRSGDWNPDESSDDREHMNALAARGYWQAYQVVRESVKGNRGEDPGAVADDDHGDWYREMFGPSVTAGLLKAVYFAGYRKDQVYIRRSMHEPPHHEAVRDWDARAFFDLLREEPDPSVCVVLGHFVFVYIHPYMDGNGRIGRFLMNVMLAAGGYPWTVIPLEKRDDYMAALESASVKQNIAQFAVFLGRLVSDTLEGKPRPHVPNQ